MELPQKPWKNTILGVSGIIVITIVLGVTLWSNSTPISRYMAQSSIDNLDKKLLKLNTLEEKIEYLVAEGDIPSIVAGIVVNDSLVWNRGWGASAVDTICPIDSIGKSFTATAILQLYERTLIELEDDVNNYIPFNIRHPEYPDKSITIRMLLSHQSGLAHARASLIYSLSRNIRFTHTLRE